MKSRAVYNSRIREARAIKEAAIAEAAEFKSIAELKAAIKDAPKKKDFISEMTDQRMLEEHG
ncbi:MAG: hypothetical protein LBV07_00240, partial [Syntrophobacterales bacterium]|nr:hypothetical protein [Syntrophobacterales bacterium]